MNGMQQFPVEARRLFNPAFCGLLLHEGIQSFVSIKKRPMPYALSYLVLPIILHDGTRGAISTRMRKPMHTWLQENPELRIGFGKRARSFVPITKLALELLTKKGIISVSESGDIAVQQRLRVSAGRGSRKAEEEFGDCLKKAQFLGKWMAPGNAATTYIMWGIQP